MTDDDVVMIIVTFVVLNLGSPKQKCKASCYNCQIWRYCFAVSFTHYSVILAAIHIQSVISKYKLNGVDELFANSTHLGTF